MPEAHQKGGFQYDANYLYLSLNLRSYKESIPPRNGFSNFCFPRVDLSSMGRHEKDSTIPKMDIDPIVPTLDFPLCQFLETLIRDEHLNDPLWKAVYSTNSFLKHISEFVKKKNASSECRRYKKG